jgi:hypothetical protein
MPFGTMTSEQRAEALKAAVEARKESAALLARVRAGELTLADLLSAEFAGNQRVRKMPVGRLLRALPGVGTIRAGQIMDELGIPGRRRVGGLGPRQREALLDWRDSQ